MALHGPWATLGIAPTDDDRAIKRAYAAKLKSIDQHGDTHAFIALRAAFEQARNQARYQREQAGHEPADPEAAEPALDSEGGAGDAEWSGTSAPLSAPADGADDHASAFDTESPDAVAAVNDALGRLADVVFADPERPVDEAAMEREFDALVALPAMDNLQIAAQVEYQLAHMACQARERTLLLAQMARYRFNWQDRVQGYDADGVFVAAEEAGMASQFFRQYQRNAYDDYREKMRADELSWFNAGPDGLKKAEKKRVTAFLTMLEKHHPHITPYLDRDRMQAWGDAGYLPKLDVPGKGAGAENNSGRWIWFVLFMLFALARLGTQFGGDNADPPQSGYSDEQRQQELRQSLENYLKDPKTQDMLEKAQEQVRQNAERERQDTTEESPRPSAAMPVAPSPAAPEPQ